MEPPRLEDPDPNGWTLEEELEQIEEIVGIFEHQPDEEPRQEPLTYEERKEGRIRSVGPEPARRGQAKCERKAQQVVRNRAEARACGYPRDPETDGHRNAKRRTPETDRRWNAKRRTPEYRAAERARRQEKKAKGRCVTCGRPAARCSVRCVACGQRVRERRRERAKGIARGGGR